MIIRSVTRQSRRTLLSQVCKRALSTETTTTTATATETPAASNGAAGTVHAPNVTPSGRPAWGLNRSKQPDTTGQDYITMTKLQRKTGKLGSSLEKLYVPGDLIRNPPTPKDVTLELLMASQTHIGHNTSLWNPANSRYILGIRQGVHIISLEETATYLRRATRVVEEVAYHSGLILFVGTRRGQMDIVVRAAELASGCHVFSKWMPGTITNRDVLLAEAPVKIVDENDEERQEKEFETHLRVRRPLVPDLVVVLNPLENNVLLHECALSNIPTIGVIDTDADPARVTYAIPGNDDSLRSTGLIAGVLARAAEIGNKRRLKDAREGIVTWEVAPDVATFMAQGEGEEDHQGNPLKHFGGGKKSLLVGKHPIS